MLRCYNLGAHREVKRSKACGRMAFLVAARSAVGEWLSLVEHLVRDQGVGGSNPLSPTNLSRNLHRGRFLLNAVLCRSLCRNCPPNWRGRCCSAGPHSSSLGTVSKYSSTNCFLRDSR